MPYTVLLKIGGEISKLKIVPFKFPNLYFLINFTIDQQSKCKKMKKISFAMLFVFCTIYICAGLNPSKEYSVTPDDYGMDYKEIKIPGEDGLELHAWMFNASKTSYKIMVLSDDGEGNMADLLELVGQFLSLGYHVLTYDYRGYGQSSDFKINKKFYIYTQFETDLNSVIDYLKKNHANIPKIHLYGQGIGASLSICVGANRKIAKIIADSPYGTFEEIKQRIKEAKDVDLLFPIGYNKIKMEPVYALETKGGTIGGILYIVGDKDDIYTPKYIKEIVKVRSNISSTYVVKGATCANTFSTNKDKYFAEIREFLR